MAFIQGLRMMFGYDAVTSSPRRAAPKSIVRSEEGELTRWQKDTLSATIADQMRNFPVMLWALNKHLDYVSRFHFQAKTPDAALNREIERAWRKWTLQADWYGRFPFERLFRLFESSKLIDGDAALMRMKGGKLAMVEGSQIAYPNNAEVGVDLSEIDQDTGLVFDKDGRVKGYAVCDINKFGQKTLKDIVDAEDMFYDMYCFRHNQWRGVSPLSTTLVDFVDLREVLRNYVTQSKVHSMFGVAITRQEPDAQGAGGLEAWQDGTGESGGPRYNYELRPGLKLELDPGDDIKTIESGNPPPAFQDYAQTILGMALRSVDIPFSFFDSTKQTNFSARKLDIVQYEDSSKSKREQNIFVLNKIAEWALPLAMAEVDGLMSKAEQYMTDDIPDFEFLPDGTPWIDELAEINAATARISAGLSSRTREAKRRGDDFSDVLVELKIEEDAIKAAGVSVGVGSPGQTMIGQQQQKPDTATATATTDGAADASSTKQDDVLPAQPPEG